MEVRSELVLNILELLFKYNNKHILMNFELKS